MDVILAFVAGAATVALVFIAILWRTFRGQWWGP